MTEFYCSRCGKKIDFDYTKYNCYFDFKTVWHEPHQQTVHKDGTVTQTLLGYFPPEDVDAVLCEDCGREGLRLLNDYISGYNDI